MIARLLAEEFGVPIASVGVSPESEFEDRNWDASVTCDYEFLHGDLACNLTVYAAEEVADQPAEEDLALAFARRLGTPVLTAWGTMPGIRKVVAPQGATTFARLEPLEAPEDWADIGAGFRVTATERLVPGLEHAPIEGFPEVVREVPAVTPVADGLFPDAPQGTPAFEVRTLVWMWESLVWRMATGWPPAGWYGAGMYREDLEIRDRLSAVIEGLAADERASVVVAMESLDAAFREHTAEDDGHALAVALEKDTGEFASAAWYWHRRPATLPWS
ncbi:hypothetical protein [Streptomyces sp. NBC_00158]|uniref:hypothetical protein n=1 Tax=Streptomyces sp. NBC_00158 TaxID=2903627 RepID=UPI0032515FF3